MVQQSKKISLAERRSDEVPQDDNSLLTRLQAAKYLRLSPATLATWASTHRHDIPYIKLGRSVRYRKSDLDQYLSHNTHRVDLAALSGNSVFTWAHKGNDHV